MSIDHPIPVDSTVTFNPEDPDKPVRRGLIYESNTSVFGTLYTIQDAEDGEFKEVNQSQIKGVRQRGDAT